MRYFMTGAMWVFEDQCNGIEYASEVVDGRVELNYKR
jgi:hypothetical protein